MSQTVHYKWTPEPTLKGDYLVAVEPVKTYGIYKVPRDRLVEPLLPVRANVATPFSTSLPALVDTGTPAKLSKKIEDINVEEGYLAEYWMIPLDAGVQYILKQPAPVEHFSNADGAIRFSKGEIDFFIENGWYSMIPKVWVLGDKTPPTIEAYSEDMDEVTYHARLEFFGYSYPVELQKDASPVGAFTTVHVAELKK